MLKLIKVNIFKYKSFTEEQEIRINDRVTLLIGKNESGKTAFLEALAKVNYFEKDSKFKLNIVADYPRNQLSKFINTETDQECIRCTFEIDAKLMKEIESDLGKGVFTNNYFSYGISFNGKTIWFDLKTNEKKFLETFLSKYDLTESLRSQLEKVNTTTDLIELWKEKKSDDILNQIVNDLNKNVVLKAYQWENKIKGYIAKHYLKPAIPKFWYFDEFYALPSRININDLKNLQLDDDSLKISRAFFELANINIDELISSDDYESYLANIETTANTVTNEIFKYWSTDRDLEIKFEIENKVNEKNKILDIRIRNSRRKVTLPLKNRSKGLNTFFSFIVWFSRIQKKNDSNYILLLDEPGLNLHSTAQADMLRFIEDLSEKYQIIYTTHSPFMINPKEIDRVRTVCDKGTGSFISEIERETNTETLYPLKAAIGFGMANRLLNNDKNCIVEDIATMIFLEVMSELLQSLHRNGLNDKIKLVPVGGISKLLAFISLLRSEHSTYLCLINSSKLEADKNDTKTGELSGFLSDFILTFDNYCEIKNAGIEDIFSVSEFSKIYSLDCEDNIILDENSNESINNQLIKMFEKPLHPLQIAQKFASERYTSDFFSETTLARFEKLFIDINSYFNK